MSHNISQALLFEYDHEMGNLRKTLERVPGSEKARFSAGAIGSAKSNM